GEAYASANADPSSRHVDAGAINPAQMTDRADAQQLGHRTTVTGYVGRSRRRRTDGHRGPGRHPHRTLNLPDKRREKTIDMINMHGGGIGVRSRPGPRWPSVRRRARDARALPGLIWPWRWAAGC